MGLVAALERCLPRTGNLMAINVMHFPGQAFLDIAVQLGVGYQFGRLGSFDHQFCLHCAIESRYSSWPLRITALRVSSR
jgi:hypothetical protein